MTSPRYMYDGIASLAPGIAKAFPKAGMVAGYLNGRYAWSQAQWDLFPGADHVTISVTASADEGDVLDVETGDARPDQCAGWIAMRKAAGLHRPTIYCSRLVIPAVRQATGAYMLNHDYDIWVADYTGGAHQVTAPGPGLQVPCAATQYDSQPGYDVSAVYDPGWPHRTAPAPPHPLAPRGMSSTLLGVDLGWQPVKDPSTGEDATHYRYQVAGGIATHPGIVCATAVVEGTSAAGVKLRGTGPWCWRVQAGNGDWSAWEAVG